MKRAVCCCVLIVEHAAHPSRLQEVPLALHAVLYVDQTQQVLLKGAERWREIIQWWTEEKTEDETVPVCLWMKGREGGKGCDTENWISGGRDRGSLCFHCLSDCECVCVCVCVCVSPCAVRKRKKASVINWGGKPKWGSTVRGERDSGGRVNYLHVLLMLEGECK